MPLTAQRIAYAADLPLCTLHMAELLVVASLRLWLCEAAYPAPGWQNGLRAAGLDAEAARAFGSLAEIVTVASIGPVDLRGLHCPRLGRSEARLLEILHRQQRGDRRAAEAALQAFLAPTAARLALGLSLDVAEALAAQGLLLGQAPAETAMRQAALSAHANRGLRLVH